MKKLESHELVHNGRNVYALHQFAYEDTTGKRSLTALQAIWFSKDGEGRLTVQEGVFYEPSETFKEKHWDALVEGMEHPAYPTYSWNGEKMTSYMKQELKVKAQQRLQEMLDNYPDIPRGYKGWYDMEIEPFDED